MALHLLLFLISTHGVLLSLDAARVSSTVQLVPWDATAGYVKALIARSSPFGFITKAGGGSDLYFNERSLGNYMPWAQFKDSVEKYPRGKAPVVFTIEEVHGKSRATGVIVLSRDQLKELDSNGDSRFSKDEIAEFLASHRGLEEDASHTEKDRGEEETRARGELYRQHQAAEDAIWKLKKAANDEAWRLNKLGNTAWKHGDKNKAKDLQAQASELWDRARALKQEALDLDLKNNKDMFEHVMNNEHGGRVRDGKWLDLHGLSVDFAEEKTMEFLLAAKEKFGRVTVEVITGAGNHSGKGGAKIKPSIEALLHNGIGGIDSISFEEVNEGSLAVSIA